MSQFKWRIGAYRQDFSANTTGLDAARNVASQQHQKAPKKHVRLVRTPVPVRSKQQSKLRFPWKEHRKDTSSSLEPLENESDEEWFNKQLARRQNVILDPLAGQAVSPGTVNICSSATKQI